MLVDAQFGECILCTRRPADSREHIIPACIGGTLQALILCTPCNSQFGAHFVGELKKDPSIRMAVWHLRDRIPDLATQIEEGLNFVAEGAGGTTVVASRKQGRWQTKTRKREGNCLEMDPKDAKNYLRNRLRKQGLSKVEIEPWVKRFEHCENGQELQVATGETFLKNEAIVRLPQLTSRFVDDRLPVLIAYEFLALCLREKIFGPDFNAIRDYVRVGTKTEQVQVLNKRTHRYSPDHRVRFRVRDNILTVFIQFFRRYVFEIRFCNIPMPSEEIAYVEDLENKTEAHSTVVRRC